MIEAELPDGTILEFPAGTDTAVIQRVVKQQLGISQQEAEPAVEEGDGNLAKSALSGVIKGAVGAASLPEMAGRGLLRLGQEGLQALGLDVGEDLPVTDTFTGRAGQAAFRKAYEYEPETGLGQVVQTIGEFGAGGGVLGAGGKLAAKAAAGAASRSGRAVEKAGSAIAEAGLTKAGQATSAVAAVGSEAGGELLEGTGAEGLGEFAGALIAPSAAIKAANKAAGFTNKTKNFLAGKNSSAPTTQTLKQEHNAAYSELDAGGFSIAANQVDSMIDDAINAARSQGADPRLHDSFVSAASKLEEFRGQRMKLSTFNELQKAISGMVDKKSPHVLTMLTSMDNFLQKVPAVGTQTQAAKRLENAKNLYKRTLKVETLEKALKKAQERTDVSGSGGNKQNNFRRAIANSLNDRRVANIWTPTERAAMERIISGNFSDNFMRLVGKMAPSGNGLMTFLNFTSAVAINPLLLGVSLGTAGVKALSDRKIDQAVKALRDMAAGGGVPKELITRDLVRELLSTQGMAPSMISDAQGEQ
jgi:hypothetical protein